MTCPRCNRSLSYDAQRASWVCADHGAVATPRTMVRAAPQVPAKRPRTL